MYYLESIQRDPYYNLALEQFVFDHLPPHQSAFMLWQNDNTIVVGKYQNTAEEINQAYVDEHQIRVARRLSGGGAVYHDQGNLNFTFITDASNVQEFQFEVFVRPVIAALKKMDIKAEFNGRNDITINGLKFSGNSQYIKNDRVMHHGCIMVDSNLVSVTQALKVKAAKFDSKSVKSVKSRVTTINAQAQNPRTVEEFKEMLKNSVLEKNSLITWELTEEQQQEVQKLRDEKYATWEWNYGKAADYDMKFEKKFTAGIVTVCLQAKEGHIKGVRFYGDFFGNGEIHELEKKMVGLPLDEKLSSCLEDLNIPYYMNGITAKDIAAMLRE